MKKTIHLSCCLMLIVAAAASVWAQSSKDDQAAVTARINSYVAAFNRRDAKAATQHWSKNAEYVSPDSGQRIRGRQAIGESLQKLLNTDVAFRLGLSNRGLRQVSKDVVIEEGIATLVSATHGTERARYLVVHVRQDGKWYRDSARETKVVEAAGSKSQLTELAWLVGHWRQQDEHGTVDIHGKWINDKRFISRSFVVHDSDGGKLQGTQIIGWDPSAGVIRSWSFDSEGGFERAVWNQDGKHWLVKVNAVLPDGSVGSEQRLVRRDGDGRMSSKVIQQQVDGQLLPGLEKVTLVRQSTK